MNKNLKSTLRIGITIGLILLVLNLERYIGDMYLQSEVNHSFLSHWPIYLAFTLIFALIYWRFELEKIKSNILKVLFVLILIGFSFYESNRVLLLVNSMTQSEIIHQDYRLKLKGVAWGEIGIEDFKTKQYDKIKASEKETKGLSENDSVQIQFNVGIFGFKYDPKLIEDKLPTTTPKLH